MAVELATAYVSLVPSAKGITGKLAEELGAPAEKAGKSAGSKISGAIGKTLKRGVIAVGVAAGGALGTALFKGWQRLSAIEEAKAKLDGLGHSATGIRTIMDNALGAVRGTAFGLGDAATVAASGVAAGIKPGKDLRRVLGLVGDTASIAGSSLGEMGAIFNKVAASNRLSLGEVNQLADRGVPILQFLAKQYNVTQDEMAKMVSAGKVGFADFAKAIETNIGGAALSSGDTTQGAFANMMAAAGRFGASLLEGVFPVAKLVFGSVTGWVDTATDAIKPFGAALGKFFLDVEGPVQQFIAGFTLSRDEARLLGADLDGLVKVGSRVKDFIDTTTQNISLLVAGFTLSRDEAREFGTDLDGLVAVGSKVRDVFDSSWDKISGIFETLSGAAKDLAPSIGTIAGSLGKATASLGVSTWDLLLTTVDALAKVAVAILVPAIEKLAGWMERNQTAVTVLVGAYTAYKVAMVGVRTVTAVTSAVMGAYRAITLGMTAASYGAAGATYAQGAALKVYNIVTKATMIATKAWAGIQWILNAALSANPIGLVVIAIAALVAGIVIAYKKSDTFRAIVDKAFTAVKMAAIWLWENGIKPLWSGVKVAFDFMAGIITWWWQNVVSPVFSTVMRIVKSLAALWWWLFSSAIKPVIAGIKTYLQIAGAAWSWLYNNAIKPAVNGIASIAKWLYSNAIKPAFDKITAAAKFLYSNGIKPAFDGIVSAAKWVYNNGIKPTFDKIVSIVGKVRDTFKSAFSKIGGFISSAFNGATSTVKGAINTMINLINKATGFINNSVISKANKIPGVDFPKIPAIPNLARGGVIPATPGGRIVRVAEAGQAEIAAPEPLMRQMIREAVAAAGGSGPRVVQNFYPAADLDERAVATMAARRIAVAGVG